MNQVFHIFQKDMRHFWRESTVSVALVAVFAWSEVRSWRAPEDFSRGAVFFQQGLPMILLFLSWWFLIARVVQDESLVGDRQFWITPPYEWKKLLAAKILFAAVFINLPLFIAQVVLLAKAGFNPASYLSGLLWMQLLLTVFLLLPTAAVAAVTSTVVQMGLASLLVILYIGGTAALSSYIPSSSFSFDSDDLQPAILVGASLVVIAWQYARRKTAKSRSLIVGAAAAIVLLVVATPYGILIEHEYPLLGAGQRLPVMLAMAPPAPHAAVEVDDSPKKDTVQIDIPWTLSGQADDSIVGIKGMMIAIEAPDSVRWDSAWASQYISLYPGQRRMQLSFELPKAFFERVKSALVKIRISLLVTVYHDKNRRDFVTPRGEFVLPDVGLCFAQAGYSNTVHCRAAMRRPSSFFVSSDLSLTTCPNWRRDPPTKPGEMGHVWDLNSDSGPAEFGLSPIQSFDLYLSTANSSVSSRGICPGTPLVLSNPEPVQAFRTTLQMDGVRLDDYRYVLGQFEFNLP
jgi:hypothetical protein